MSDPNMRRSFFKIVTSQTIGASIAMLLGAASAHSQAVTEFVRGDGWATVESSVRRELAARYGGAKIEWTSAPTLNGEVPAPAPGQSRVQIESEPAPGVVRFVVSGFGGARTTGSIGFRAYTPAWIALRRIMPGEALRADDLSRRMIDVSSGLAHENRTLLLPEEARLETLEARHTILEGSFITTAAVKRAPDVRKGESLKVRLQAGALELSSQGIAEESGSRGDTVRVQILKTKRTLVGRLLEDGSVEVRL